MQEGEKSGGPGKQTDGEAEIVFRTALNDKVCTCEGRKDYRALTESFNWKRYCCQSNTHPHPICLPMKAHEILLLKRFMW